MHHVTKHEMSIGQSNTKYTWTANNTIIGSAIALTMGCESGVTWNG